MDDTRVEEILTFWFGNVETTVMPSSRRTQVWFGASEEHDQNIRALFSEDLEKAAAGQYLEWTHHPRSTLALIIIFDQFARNMFRGTPQSFAHDDQALDLCLKSIDKQFDHAVSLIERAFFYMPLMHSEDLSMQETSLQAFQMLVDLALPETRGIFEGFYKYAVKHYDIIKRFGRYPHRNSILNRESTEEELEFLKQPGSSF